MGDVQEGALDPTIKARLEGKRVVTIGGGTGPFAVLSSLKNYPCSITAIVTMSDSGGSSRRLMDEFGQLPLGDLRQALVALSRPENLWRDVFTFRFEPEHSQNGNGNGNSHAHPTGRQASFRSGDSGTHAQVVAIEAGVTGHSLGNLIISALEVMSQKTSPGNSLIEAIEKAQQLLDTAGRVLPVTTDHATLCARLENGEMICGESDIDTRGEKDFGSLSPISHIFLQDSATANKKALEAIHDADIIILGPGDLYTSILPNLLVDGVADAIKNSKAEETIYVCNLMTKHGETDGYRASDFVQRIGDYIGAPVHRVILHDGVFPDDILSAYAAKAQYPVEADIEAVKELGPKVVTCASVHAVVGNFVRHDPERLLQAIVGEMALERESVD